jgi:predicted metal-binding protein
MIPDNEQNELKAILTHLKQEAMRFGATDSAVISSGDIRVDNCLAALCNGEYTCPNYGLAASCPPHVEGPEQFKKWQEKSRYSITVKIELPASVMFSDGRKEIMMLLPCRHMNEARPSMSGFGIDVIQLMNTSGWPIVKTKQNNGGPEDSSWLAGMVLVA